MNELFSKMVLVSIAIHFYLLIYGMTFSKQILNPNDYVIREAYIVFAQPKKLTINLNFDFIKSFEIAFASLCKSQLIRIANDHREKTYTQFNQLQFNQPQICYKFPLSQHTEEG